MSIGKTRFLILLVVIIEVALRVFAPELGADLFQDSPLKNESPFIYNDKIGFKPKSSTIIDYTDCNGVKLTERLNNEGFRGPEYVVPKPSGTFRILAIGDSVVQGFSVSYKNTWEKVLEDRLRSQAIEKKIDSNYEVINAGVGGYLSWQALLRLEEHGIKYQPDIVLVLVGWNDMIFSSLASWNPKIDLSKIEEAYIKNSHEQDRDTLWSRIRTPIYRISYIARSIRKIRNGVWNVYNTNKIIEERRRFKSSLSFNEEALNLYLDNLERIYHTTKAHNAKMGLILWPTILKAGIFDDFDLNKRLIVVYQNFPLSSKGLWDWYTRYIDAQKEFANRHRDIILIDGTSAFRDKDKYEQLQLFSDLSHLTDRGNRELALLIFRELIRQKAIGT